jgi:hypothetical protein
MEAFSVPCISMKEKIKIVLVTRLEFGEIKVSERNKMIVINKYLFMLNFVYKF